MNHTIDTANGFKIEQRGVGHIWMHFMATREATGEGKSHTDLGTLKAWCEAQAATSIDQRMEAHAEHTRDWIAHGRPKHGRPDTVGYEVLPSSDPVLRAEREKKVGDTLQEIAEKGFAGWMGFDSNGWAINTEAGKE